MRKLKEICIYFEPLCIRIALLTPFQRVLVLGRVLKR